MKNIAKQLHGWPATIIHISVIPFFAFDFSMLFKPFGMVDFLNMEQELFIFNLTILSCILLGVLAITRIIFHFLKPVMPLNYFLYGLWCTGEITIFSAFGAMYISLMSKGGLSFFDALLLCQGCSMLILCFPYTIICLSFVIHSFRNSGNGIQEDSSIIKFRDYRHSLKLAISCQSILYIEADNNYVIINYLNGDKLCNYTLRSSMKDIDNLVTPFGIVRCQRTYFINPMHVKLLSRNKEGYIYAETDCPEAKHIPVSKTYYEKLSLIL